MLCSRSDIRDGTGFSESLKLYEKAVGVNAKHAFTDRKLSTSKSASRFFSLLVNEKALAKQLSSQLSW